MKHVQAREIKSMLNTKRKVISLIGNHGNKTTFMCDKCSYETCTGT